MKHDELSATSIMASARDAGIVLANQQAQAVERHARLVLEFNEQTNLTTVVEPVEFLERHVLDSLMALPEVESGPAGDLVDIGSGGGYPAIAFAITSGRRVVMLESIAKKSRFLNDVVTTLSLAAEAVPARAEEYALTHRECFAVCTARAVADLAALVELAAPLLILGGIFVGLKGDLSEEELSRGDAAATVLGLRRTQLRRYTLGKQCAKRAIVVYEKAADTPARFPRRIGMAQKRPLA